MKPGQKRSGEQKNGHPTENLSRQERKRYLDAARKRQNRRKLQSFSGKLKKKNRKDKQQHAPSRRRRVITENWLENREMQEEKAKPVREIPAWFLPLLSLVLLVALLFVILPTVVNRFIDTNPTADDEGNDVLERIYDETVMLARRPVVDVFSEADIQSERYTQLLYNEAVTRLDPVDNDAEFIRVRLANGTVGYCRRIDLEEDSDAIEPGDAISKLVVTDLTKRVLSHASNGNLVVEVKMNTELFVVYSSDPLYRVKLPGGREGWVDSTGVLELSPTAQIDVAGASYFTDSIMAFNYATYLSHGLSNEGISLAAAVHIAAAVNGMDVPRDIAGIQNVSAEVSPIYNENNSVNFSAFNRGDILFFGEEEGGVPTRIAVWVDYGIVLAERPREFVIRETDINTLLNDLVLIRAGRIFLE